MIALHNFSCTYMFRFKNRHLVFVPLGFSIATINGSCKLNVEWRKAISMTAHNWYTIKCGPMLKFRDLIYDIRTDVFGYRLEQSRRLYFTVVIDDWTMNQNDPFESIGYCVSEMWLCSNQVTNAIELQLKLTKLVRSKLTAILYDLR